MLRLLALWVASLLLGRLMFHGAQFVELLETFAEGPTPSAAHTWVDESNAYLFGGGKFCVVALAGLLGMCSVGKFSGARRAADFLRASESWWATALFIATLVVFGASAWLPLRHAVDNHWPELGSAASSWARLWSALVTWTCASFILWWLALVDALRRKCRSPQALWRWAAALSCVGIATFAGGLLWRWDVCCWVGAACWLSGSSGTLVGLRMRNALHWRTTCGVLSLAVAVSIPFLHLGSAFAWERTHPLGASSGPVGSASTDPRPDEHVIPSLIIPGQVHMFDAAAGLSTQQLVRALGTQRKASQFAGAGRTPSLLLTDDSNVRHLEAALEAAFESGHQSVRLVARQTYVQERPVLGPWRQVTLTTLPAAIAREPAKCHELDAQPVQLARGASASSLSWFRDLVDAGKAQRVCLLLPPIACDAALDACSDPRRAGWVVTGASVLGSRTVALRFEGRQGEHLTAFIPKTESIQVLSRVQGDEPFETFPELEQRLQGRGRRLLWAMNGGMYMEDRRALGLLVSDGVQLARLNQRTGKGNFYLEPNGVFMISDSGRPEILTTAEYARAASVGLPRQATQSGPIVIEGGVVNPLFDPQSTSRFVRNGVCVGDRYLVLDITITRVSFHEFASFLRDLGCEDALYLDGNVSSVYAPAAGREDNGFGLGPVLIATEPLAERN